MTKTFVKIMSWFVLSFNAVMAVLVIIEAASGFSFFEQAGFKQIAVFLSWAWITAIPLISAAALILNLRIRWKPGFIINGITLAFWLFCIILVIYVNRSGLAYW